MAYTIFVRFGKVFLWLLAAGIVAAVVWVGAGNNSENGGRMVFTNIPQSAPLENIMKKPYYQGVDVHNRPYNISADSGLQKDKNTVELENIVAEMTGDNNAWVALNSGHGVLSMDTKLLELSKGVEVFYEGGYQFRTDHAHVDINKGTANGDSPIEGQGAVGTIKAKSFSISERGNIINFNGSVTMLLYQDRKKQ